MITDYALIAVQADDVGLVGSLDSGHTVRLLESDDQERVDRLWSAWHGIEEKEEPGE